MELKFCSLASGSKGNCYAVWQRDNIFLVDVGISGKKIEDGLASVGLDISQVTGVFITHEHIDHTKSIKMICKKSPLAKIYTRPATWAHIRDERMKDDSLNHRFIPIESSIVLGDLTIETISTNHDAVDPVGYKISCKERKLSILTDTGSIDDKIFQKIKDSHLLLLESNHEENILQVCSYPYKTKMRILSDFGHLSNSAAASCIKNILSHRVENIPDEDLIILLAHLSADNNSEHLAKQAANNAIEIHGWKPDKFHLDVVRQDKISKVYKV